MWLFIPGMKRLLIYPLLFFFALNPLAFYLMLEMHRIRMEVETGKITEPRNITMLVIPENYPPASFQWKDKNEFSFEGKLYDVAKLEKKNGMLFLYCMQDKNEDTLLAFMKKLTGNKYFSFYTDDIVKMPPAGSLHGLLHSSSGYRYPMITELMKSVSRGTLSPPPKQA
jgi:hypothetical protein